MAIQTQHLGLNPRRWLMAVLDLLYPVRCGGCSKVGKGVWCESCDAAVQRLYPPLQTRPLALHTPWEAVTIDVTSAARYAEPLRDGIHTFKYDGTPDLAGSLGQLMAEAWVNGGLQADVLVPVPLHPRRRRERGYNQSELLAKKIGALVGVTVDMAIIRRVRYTDQQAMLARDERRNNVHGAFKAEPARSNGKHIMLVDDVFTTGATLSECAATLLGAGAWRVSAMTLARAS
jgi:ComF family protein